jgi:hypothetical protein
MGTDLFEPRGHSIADSLFCECSLLETSGQEAVEAVLRTPNNDWPWSLLLCTEIYQVPSQRSGQGPCVLHPAKAWT